MWGCYGLALDGPDGVVDGKRCLRATQHGRVLGPRIGNFVPQAYLPEGRRYQRADGIAVAR